MMKKPAKQRKLPLAAIILGAVAVVAGAVALALALAGGPGTFTGYLICQDCGLSGKCGMDNTDLATHPEKHTLKCLKKPECITSGYGIAVKRDDGKYKFYPFDAEGSKLALDNVVYSTKRTDALLVEVRGKLEGNRIMVEAIAEK